MLVSIPFFHNSWNSEGIIGLKYFKTIDDKIINYVFQTGEDSYDDVIQAVNTDIRSMFGTDREALFRDVPALRDIYRLQDNIFN